MANLLQIPGEYFTAAAQAVAQIRRINDPNVDTDAIEKTLRSYVRLGQGKQIQDWSYALDSGTRDEIVQKVRAGAQDYYYLQTPYERAYNDLEIMETQAARGLVAPSVARPRQAQERYEASLATAPELHPVQEGITNFFGVLKSGLDAVLKGLGINIPFEAILMIAALFVVFLFTGGFSRS